MLTTYTRTVVVSKLTIPSCMHGVVWSTPAMYTLSSDEANAGEDYYASTSKENKEPFFISAPVASWAVSVPPTLSLDEMIRQ